MFCFQGSYQRNPLAWSLISVLITQAICWWSENCRFVWESVSLLWMQFTAHRKRCGIHRITSILYHITRTNVGVFPAILGLLWRISRHTSNFLLFLIAVRNIRLFWMVGSILHWAASSFGKLCMSYPSFFCIDIAASYLKNSFLSRQSPCILYDRKRTLNGVIYTIKVSFLV